MRKRAGEVAQGSDLYRLKVRREQWTSKQSAGSAEQVSLLDVDFIANLVDIVSRGHGAWQPSRRLGVDAEYRVRVITDNERHGLASHLVLRC